MINITIQELRIKLYITFWNVSYSKLIMKKIDANTNFFEWHLRTSLSPSFNLTHLLVHFADIFIRLDVYIYLCVVVVKCAPSTVSRTKLGICVNGVLLEFKKIVKNNEFEMCSKCKWCSVGIKQNCRNK